MLPSVYFTGKSEYNIKMVFLAFPVTMRNSFLFRPPPAAGKKQPRIRGRKRDYRHTEYEK